MRNPFKRKATQQAFEWDPKYWDEIGEIAEPRADHYGGCYPDGTEPITPEEYTAWLTGYVARGGEITDHRRYVCNSHMHRTHTYRISYADVVVKPVHFSNAYYLVVRKGLTWSAPNGHENVEILEMDGFTTTDPNTVEEFYDTAITPRSIRYGKRTRPMTREEIRRQERHWNVCTSPGNVCPQCEGYEGSEADYWISVYR